MCCHQQYQVGIGGNNRKKGSIPVTGGNSSGPTHSNAGFLPFSSHVTWTFSMSFRLLSTLAMSYRRRTLAVNGQTARLHTAKTGR